MRLHKILVNMKVIHMNVSADTDNFFKEGTVVVAKANSDVELRIVKYYDGIYYCAVEGNPDHKILVYFERELLSQVIIDQPGQFTRIEERPGLSGRGGIEYIRS